MAGPPAHHPDARRRRNRKATAAELKPPREPKGPELPDEYVLMATGQGTITREYDEQTRAWWDTIRRAPQAGRYLEAHWRWLLVLAPLYDRWVAMGDLAAMKELRLQAPPFGLRPADANKMDWTIDPTIVGGAQDETDDEGEPAADEEPPRSGKGSGKQVWRRYVTEVLGLEVADDATRADMIELVDAQRRGRPARRDPRMTVYDGGAAAGA